MKDTNPQLTDRGAVFRHTLYRIAVIATLLVAGSVGIVAERSEIQDSARRTPKAVSQFSQCNLCHSSFDDFENPKITFRHGPARAAHAGPGGGCGGCHDTQAHSQERRILRPNGRSCQKCHNNDRARRGAAYRCALCHPADFLASVPSVDDYDHVATATVAARPYVAVDLTLPIKKSKCNSCHVVGTASPAVRFNHAVHLKKGVQCFGCHWKKPHQKGKPVQRPNMRACSVCHGLSHGGQGAVARKECDFCHTKGWRRRPVFHTDNWMTDHKIEYKRGVNCMSCHAKSTCVSCHGMEEIPHPVDWRKTHEQAGSGRYRPVCMNCHEKDRARLCESCHHEGYNPEAGEWVSARPGESLHPRFVEERGAGYCLSCHSPAFCPKCHANVAR